MRLIRNTTADGKCKYALVRLDKLHSGSSNDCYHQALNILERGSFLEYGKPNSEEECFVIKLKDKFAPGALAKYAMDVCTEDPELAKDVIDLVARAVNHPNRKRPD